MKVATGIYARGRQFRVSWNDGGRHRWASFTNLEDAEAFREATKPPVSDDRDPVTGRMVAEPYRAVLHCAGCGHDLPREDFAPRPSRPKGVTSRCKDCLRRSARQDRARARATDPERERELWNAWARTPRGRESLRAAQERRRGSYDCAATERYARDVLAGDPCAYCGHDGGTVDHIIPLCGGGDRSPDNLTGACMGCNRRKSRAPLLTFLLREREREAVI